MFKERRVISSGTGLSVLSTLRPNVVALLARVQKRPSRKTIVGPASFFFFFFLSSCAHRVSVEKRQPTSVAYSNPSVLWEVEVQCSRRVRMGSLAGRGCLKYCQVGRRRGGRR